MSSTGPPTGKTVRTTSNKNGTYWRCKNLLLNRTPCACLEVNVLILGYNSPSLHRSILHRPLHVFCFFFFPFFSSLLFSFQLFECQIFDHQRTYKFGINPKQSTNDGRPYYTLIDEDDEEKFDDLCVVLCITFKSPPSMTGTTAPRLIFLISP